jgi:hypothetical protein
MESFITAREVVSLSLLEIPEKSKKKSWKAVRHLVSMTCLIFRLRLRLLDARNVKIPALEGKTIARSPADEKVLFAVGDCESLAHLSGVGTIVQTGHQKVIHREQKLTRLLLGVLFWNEIQSRRSGSYLPFPPFPNNIQHDLEQIVALYH